MKKKSATHAPISCLCNALRQASRAVSRLYDDELRAVGLRVTQYSLLRALARSGEVRQGELGDLTHLDETSLTRALRPLAATGWVEVRTGEDRRQRLISLTAAGRGKLDAAEPIWERAQTRTKGLLPKGVWQELLATLPDVARRAAAG